MATKAQQEWNKGLTGDRPAGREVQRPGNCTTNGCGALHNGKTPKGMRRVHVEGSSEPARVYCSPFCVEYGRALAELRALPVEGGDR